MREIKFRGLHENGMWAYGGFYKGSTGNSIIAELDYTAPTQSNPCGDLIVNFVCVKDETVGQYTGLKDKSGVEIYFDDVVKIYGYGYLHVSDIGDLVALVDASAEGDIGEIKGNIHQRPELLEQS